MGSDNSKPKISLAEKRYKVERQPAKKKVRSASHVPSVTKRNSTAISSESNSSIQREATSEGNLEETRHFTPEVTETPMVEISGDSVLRRPLHLATHKHFLTRKERLLLEHSWKKSKKTGTEHVGSKIFLMVLTAQPDIKGIFGLEKIPQGRLKYDPRFRQHAQVFTKTFDYVIKNLEYPDKMEQHFESLGRRHVAMQGRGFDPLYWETFAECMTQTAVEWEAHRQRVTLSAWRNLVSTIITFMRRGFDDENTKRKFHQYPRNSIRPPIQSSYRAASPVGK